MIVNRRGGMLHKTGFIWIIAIAISVVFSDIQAAPAKPVKQTPTQTAAKMDPSEWKKVIEAAKKEGKIVLSGPVGEGWRKSLVDMFQQEYPEITVEFIAGPGRNFLTRIRQERRPLLHISYQIA